MSVDHADKELQDLVATGKTQRGYLTYDQVNNYLPNEAVNPEKLDALLMALEEMGIELVEELPADEVVEAPVAGTEARTVCSARIDLAVDESADDDAPTLRLADEPERWSDDPIRMYLSQMAEIPLLTREQEIALAKKIEITRKRFRRTLLACDLAMRATIETLTKVHAGALPFDRTIKVSLTEQLTKQQILSRMPHNLRTLDSGR
jgi:RNA polymerase primary sigma factor